MPLSEREVHWASEAAQLVRLAAYSGTRTPGWGSSLLIGGGAFLEGEVAKPVESALIPVRREPCGELARIDFDPAPGDAAAAHQLVDAVIREVGPFIVGVGEVVAEETPEGFVVFLADGREVSGGHDVILSRRDLSAFEAMFDAWRSEWPNAEVLAVGGTPPSLPQLAERCLQWSRQVHRRPTC